MAPMTAMPTIGLTNSSVQSGACDSCGAMVTGKFCASCGARQDGIVGRKTVEVAKLGGVLGESTVDDETSKQKLVGELMEIVQKKPSGPKPGLSNEAKSAKDLLEKDPYNMDLIYKLGLAYAHDEQWRQSANVLLRGWKRTKEIADVQMRFEFLVILTQGSMNLKKFRQALAVLEDIEVPLEFNAAALSGLKCQVYCANGDAPRGLKAFNDAIMGLDFDQAAAQWALCHEHLATAGLAETTKTILKNRVVGCSNSKEEIHKLDMMETIIEVKASYKKGQTEPKLHPVARMMLYIVVAAFVVITLYALHILEKMNLKSHNIEL